MDEDAVVWKIDWKEDLWFRRCWAEELTPEFKKWWVDYYNTPDFYADERHEYWVRCAFAWQGWKARGKG